jgi:phytochelatin synthase
MAFMKRRNIVGVLAAAGLIAASLLAAGALVVGPTKVSPQAIASSVTRTPELMERAWRLPVAATFERQVAWQSNGSRCGPAAVANVNRSLGEAPNTEGKVLAGTGRCWTGVCILGLTLDELADVARANSGRKVTVLRDLGEDEFREHLRRSNDSGRRYIVNFSRNRIFGAGVGHHSPIGGYLEPEDLVFVLDVNRDYQPWLVEGTRLFEAVDTLDGDKKRGLLLIE